MYCVDVSDSSTKQLKLPERPPTLLAHSTTYHQRLDEIKRTTTLRPVLLPLLSCSLSAVLSEHEDYVKGETPVCESPGT